MPAEDASLQFRWNVDTSGAVQSVGRLRDEVGRFVKAGEAAPQKVSSAFGSLGAKIDGVGAKMSAVGATIAGVGTLVTGALGGIGFAKAISEAFEFEHSIGRLRTQVAGTSAGMGAYGIDVERSVKAMAGALGSANELALALVKVRQSGVPAAESLRFLEVAARAAKATGAELGMTIEALDAALDAFNLGAGEAAMMADLLAKGASVGEKSFQDFTGSISAVMPVAAALGVKVEEVVGAMASLTKHGVDAGLAATQLRTLLLGLTNASDKLGEVGINVSSLLGKGGLTAVLEAMQRATGGSADALREAGLSGRQLGQAMLLLDKDSRGLTSVMQEMGSASGTVAKKWEVARKEAGALFDELRNRLGVVLIEVGKRILVSVLPAMEKLSDLLKKGLDSGAVDALARSVGNMAAAAVRGAESVARFFSENRTAVLTFGGALASVWAVKQVAAYASAVWTFLSGLPARLAALNPLVAVLGLIASAAVVLPRKIRAEADEEADALVRAANAGGGARAEAVHMKLAAEALGLTVGQLVAKYTDWTGLQLSAALGGKAEAAAVREANEAYRTRAENVERLFAMFRGQKVQGLTLPEIPPTRPTPPPPGPSKKARDLLESIGFLSSKDMAEQAEVLTQAWKQLGDVGLTGAARGGKLFSPIAQEVANRVGKLADSMAAANVPLGRFGDLVRKTAAARFDEMPLFKSTMKIREGSVALDEYAEALVRAAGRQRDLLKEVAFLRLVEGPGFVRAIAGMGREVRETIAELEQAGLPVSQELLDLQEQVGKAFRTEQVDRFTDAVLGVAAAGGGLRQMFAGIGQLLVEEVLRGLAGIAAGKKDIEGIFGALLQSIFKTKEGAIAAHGSLAGVIGSLSGPGGRGEKIGGAAGSVLGGIGASLGGKVLTGAVTKIFGQTLGKAFGAALPVIGPIVGQLIGSFIGKLFDKKPAWQKLQDSIARDLGVSVTEGTARALIQLKEKIGTGFGRSFRATLGLDLILKDAEITRDNFAKLGAEAVKQIGLIAQGGKVGEIALAGANASLGILIAKARELGTTGTKTFGDMIRAAKQTGKEFAELTKFLRESVALAVEGLGQVFKGFAGETAEDLTRIGVISANVFDAMLALPGGARKMIETLGDSLDAIVARTHELGLELPPSLARILDLREKFKDNAPLFEALDGLTKIAKGLGEAGFIGAEAFAAIEQEAQAVFDRLTAIGLDRETALQEMAPLLQQIVNEHVRNGAAIDAETQALIDQAVGFKLVKDEGVGLIVTLQRGFQGVVDILGKAFRIEVPAIFNEMARHGVAAAERVGGAFREAGRAAGEASGLDKRLPGFQHGGVVRSTGPAILHEGERVVPAGGAQGPMNVYLVVDGRRHLLATIREWVRDLEIPIPAAAVVET